MLKNKTKIIVAFIAIILLLTTCVFAENEVMSTTTDTTNSTEIQPRTEENNTTSTQPQEEKYKSSDVYLAEDNITIDYIVDGNVFACGKTVTINSQIGGDAFIIADTIIIGEQGYVFSNLFACANSIEVKGVVYDIFGCSENITISGGYVYRDVKALCSNFTVNGTIGRNAFISCENINFNTDELGKGIIYGNLNYYSESEKSIPEGVVTGEVKFTQETLTEELSTSEIISNYIVDLGSFLALALIIWLLCLWLTPKFVNNTNKFVGKISLKVFGVGLLSLIVLPIITIVLLIIGLTSVASLTLFALYSTAANLAFKFEELYVI